MSNVVVSCRFRPPSKGEKAEGATVVTTVDDSRTSVTLNDGSNQVREGMNKFNFDHVFDFTTTQAEVYNATAKPLVKDVFTGFNTTIFAYGQTGSGKTWTMMGNPKVDEHKGIIPRLVESIFQGIEDAEVGIEFTVKLSYVEIYNERVRDLLTARNANSDNLKIREGTHGGVYIEGVTESYVNSVEQVYQMMEAGQANRAIASTNMNETSSRSHSVFILTLGQLDQNTGSKRGAKLTLVDLAGSEKVGKTGAAGQTLEEAKGINKSLSALGNVVNAISTNAAFVPYRDSKLTRLLSDSLGGNSKTVLIITGSPMNTNMEETQSTCRFGLRAKLIVQKAKINQEKSVAEYKILLHQATLKLGIQAQIIAALEKDVAALMECVAAVDPPSALKIPIPALISQDPEMMAQFQRESGEDPGATGGDVSMALTVPTSLPPVAKSPAPAGSPTLSASNSLNLGNTLSPMPPSTPQPNTTPRPPPPPSTSPPVAPAAAASASASPPPPASAAAAAAAATAGMVTPVKPTARAVRRPAAGAGGSSDEDSPPTSPDTSPDSSPVLAPAKPPVVTMGLPSLASLAAAPAAAAAAGSAAAAPAASPAASNPVAAYRKPSAIAGHSMSELMLANSDLHQQVAELRQARLALEHNLADNRSETQELTEGFEKDKKAMADGLEEAQRRAKEAEERAEKAMETVTELNALKQKIEYLKKEQALALSQSDAARTEALEEKDALAARVAVLEAKMAAQKAAHESVMNKLASENAAASAAAAAAVAAASSAAAPFEDPLTSPSAASAPNTPQAASATERKILRPRMSEPPQSTSGLVRTHAREASNDFHPLLASSGGRGSISGAAGLAPPELAAPEFTIEEQNQIEQLNRGLKRKCDQYIQLMMQHQAQGERVESLESSLDESNARLKEHLAVSSKKIKELDEKLQAAESLCAKFVESGRYFRQERSAKQSASAKATSSKIAMPLHGGGGNAARAMQGGGGGGGGTPATFLPAMGSPSGSTQQQQLNSSATMSPGGPSSSVSSPAPAPAPQSATSRLSGGFARMTAAFSSKPKPPPPSGDSMSAFF